MNKLLELLNKWKAVHVIISIGSAIILSKVFWEEALDRTVDWKDYIAYAIAMSITYMPTLAIRVIDAFSKSKGNDVNTTEDK